MGWFVVLRRVLLFPLRVLRIVLLAVAGMGPPKPQVQRHEDPIVLVAEAAVGEERR
jgi:hypothetical protein